MYGFKGLQSIADRKDYAERRRAGRVVCLSVSCQFGGVADLSRSGARVRLSRSAPPVTIGERTHLTLHGPLEPLTVAAKVVWRTTRLLGCDVIGLQFIDPDTRMRRALAELALVAVNGSELAATPTPARRARE